MVRLELPLVTRSSTALTQMVCITLNRNEANECTILQIITICLGQHYDKDGNRRQWWTNQTIMAFNNRAECFVKQYSSYIIENLNENVILPAIERFYRVNSNVTHLIWFRSMVN